MYSYKFTAYLLIFTLIGIYSCDSQEGNSPPPDKVHMVQKISDLDNIEQGIDAVPEKDGIRIEWNLLLDPEIESYAVYRKAQDESIFSPLITIPVEGVISYYDTVFSYVDSNNIQLDNTGSYNYYYVRAVNKDGIKGDNSDTVKYMLFTKPFIEDVNDLNSNEQPILSWHFQGGNIPNYYIIRFENEIFEGLLWTRRFLNVGLLRDKVQDLSSVANPPQFQSGTRYRWRIDSVGPDSLFSGSESNWKAFLVN